MSKEKVLGIIRHVITFAGGILVTKGLIEESMVQELGGSIITLVGALWSVLSKKN